MIGKWHLAWLLASFVISFATNRAFKPHVEHPLSPGQRTLATGTLRFDGRGEELKIVNVFVVAQDLPRVLSEPLRVRELLIRSPEGDDGQEPDVELFFDFSPPPKSPPIAADARDLSELRERELPLLATAIGEPTTSRVRFPGAGAPSFAREGDLRITEVFELDEDESGASWRIEGDVQLLLAEADGEHMVKGTISARVTW